MTNEYQVTDSIKFQSFSADPAREVVHYPFCLVYNKNGRSWDFSVMSSPNRTVELNGDTPTRDEIIESLMSLPGATLLLLSLIEGVIGVLRPEAKQ